MLFSLLLAVVFGNSAFAALEPKVLFVVIDGVRSDEITGQARDDSGRLVPANRIFPNLLRLARGGLFLDRFSIANPVGISLPAYADMFSGRRREKILSNSVPVETLRAETPTLFEAVYEKLGKNPSSVSVHSSWEPVCTAAVSTKDPAPFYLSCGYKNGKWADRYIRSEPYPGSRNDADTLAEFIVETKKRKPRLSFLHFVNADQEGHFLETLRSKTGVDTGILRYHQALAEIDHYLGIIWKELQADPNYRDQTYLVITTDHGRDNFPNGTHWASHGHCVKEHGAKSVCVGCKAIFAVVVGPGVRPGTVHTPYTQVDLAPTIAKIFGATLEGATGHPIEEVFLGQRTTVPTRVGRK